MNIGNFFFFMGNEVLNIFHFANFSKKVTFLEKMAGVILEDMTIF